MNAENKTSLQKTRFSVAVTTPQYQQLIANTLNDPQRSARFIASITSAVSVTPALQECTPQTIIAGALLGESLNLSPSPQLGQYYLVPFNKTIKDESGEKHTIKQAQFVLGYKGYIQLAIRSGYYRHINVVEVKEGEFINYNPFTEEFDAQWMADANERSSARTVGYVAMFEYINGFRKLLYWTKKQMLLHADTYSQAFSIKAMEQIENGEIPEKDMWKYSSFWYKDFDGMAKKTMLRQLISKWGIMSTEMQTAFERDASVHEFNGKDIVYGHPESIGAAESDAEPQIVDHSAQEVADEVQRNIKQVNLDEV